MRLSAAVARSGDRQTGQRYRYARPREIAEVEAYGSHAPGNAQLQLQLRQGGSATRRSSTPYLELQYREMKRKDEQEISSCTYLLAFLVLLLLACSHMSVLVSPVQKDQLVPTVAKPPQSSAASPASFTGSGSGSFGGSGSGSGSGSFPFLPFFFLPAVINPPQSSSAGGGAGASGSGSGSGSSVNALPFFCATRQRVLLSKQRYLVDNPPSCPSFRQLRTLPILY